LDQKWHCEKGLSGLKMDLDRSHQETGSLRQLLYDATKVPQDGVQGRRPPQRQDSLDKAYNELQTTHALSLAHVNGLASPSSLGRNNDSAHILSLLNKSISDAQAERNAAQEQAELYRKQARELQRAELDHIGKEQSLAKELYASATRMDQLAAQVKVQLDANSDLRQRLAGAIDRGEQEQASSAERIAELQGKLRVLEDSLVAAQQTSEDAITGHEEQVRLLQESSKQSTALQRQNAWSTGLVADGPASPLPPHLFALKSPRLDKTSSGTGMSMGEQTRTPQLEQRVRELETALAEAEGEMGKVVSRMNRAQIEVAELQGERYVITLSLQSCTGTQTGVL
jgi:chromosome segregation ATPase